MNNITRILRAAFVIAIVLAPVASARAITLSGVTLQNVALDRYWNTQGPDAGFNLYLSQNSGASFLNSGDAASTSVNLTLAPGANTFQFYGDTTGDASLELALFFDGVNGTPRITASNAANGAGNAFTPYSTNVRDVSLNSVTGSGTVLYSSGATTVTLTSFFYAAGPDFVSPFNNVTNTVRDEVGAFTLNVTTVPETGTFALLVPAMGLMSALVIRRKRAA